MTTYAAPAYRYGCEEVDHRSSGKAAHPSSANRKSASGRSSGPSSSLVTSFVSTSIASLFVRPLSPMIFIGCSLSRRREAGSSPRTQPVRARAWWARVSEQLREPFHRLVDVRDEALRGVSDLWVREAVANAFEQVQAAVGHPCGDIGLTLP